jgi:hypothetical protein
MVYGRTSARYRSGGRFYGRRVNCERVPMLPGLAVREVLDDPRKIPYLLVWKNDGGQIKEAARVIGLGPTPYLPTADSVELKRTDGSVVHIRAIKWSLPRNGGYSILLACPYCCSLRRALYGWEPGGPYTSSAQRCGWQCRGCAGLRYASEGGALVLRSRGHWFRELDMRYGRARSDRPDPWHPYVFSSPADAVAAGFCISQREEQNRQS